MGAQTTSVIKYGLVLLSLQGVHGNDDTMVALIASSTCALVMFVVALIITGLVVVWKDIVEDYYRKRGFIKVPPYKRKWLRGKSRSHVSSRRSASNWDPPQRPPVAQPLPVIWREREPTQSSNNIGLVYPPFEEDFHEVEGHTVLHQWPQYQLHPAHAGLQPSQVAEIEDGKRSGADSIARKSTTASQRKYENVGYYVENVGQSNAAYIPDGPPEVRADDGGSRVDGNRDRSEQQVDDMAELSVHKLDQEKVTQF